MSAVGLGWYIGKALRKDLDGKTRPINIEPAFDNINFDRKKDWVETNLIAKPALIREDGPNREYLLGKRNDLLFYVKRIHLVNRWKDDTNPGPFDYELGISYILNIDKYDSLYRVNLKNNITKRIHQRSGFGENISRDFCVLFENDTSMFALGESIYEQAEATAPYILSFQPDALVLGGQFTKSYRWFGPHLMKSLERLINKGNSSDSDLRGYLNKRIIRLIPACLSRNGLVSKRASETL